MEKKRVAMELSKKEPSAVENVEKWFEEAFINTFPLFGPSWWPKRSPSESESWKPPVDIYEDGKDVILKAELPGMKNNGVQVDLHDDLITISGERKWENKADRENYYRSEVSYGTFSRTFRLPVQVEGEKAKAKFKNGILEVRIPKMEEEEEKPGIEVEIK